MDPEAHTRGSLGVCGGEGRGQPARVLLGLLCWGPHEEQPSAGRKSQAVACRSRRPCKAPPCACGPALPHAPGPAPCPGPAACPHPHQQGLRVRLELGVCACHLLSHPPTTHRTLQAHPGGCPAGGHRFLLPRWKADPAVPPSMQPPSQDGGPRGGLSSFWEWGAVRRLNISLAPSLPPPLDCGVCGWGKGREVVRVKACLGSGCLHRAPGAV